LGDVAAIVARAPSLAVAAVQLGVDRSTIWRWQKSGKLTQAVRGSASAPEVVAPDQSAEEWAAGIRREHILSSTQLQVLDLAARRLNEARDPAVPLSQQLAASAMFQKLVMGLHLDVEAKEQPAARPRRVMSGDPRAALVAVK
jgi:hypothetical protein